MHLVRAPLVVERELVLDCGVGVGGEEVACAGKRRVWSEISPAVAAGRAAAAARTAVAAGLPLPGIALAARRHGSVASIGRSTGARSARGAVRFVEISAGRRPVNAAAAAAAATAAAASAAADGICYSAAAAAASAAATAANGELVGRPGDIFDLTSAGRAAAAAGSRRSSGRVQLYGAEHIERSHRSAVDAVAAFASAVAVDLVVAAGMLCFPADAVAAGAAVAAVAADASDGRRRAAAAVASIAAAHGVKVAGSDIGGGVVPV